jgi:hypothetical protein
MRLTYIEKGVMREFLEKRDWRDTDNWADLCDVLLEVGRGNRKFLVEEQRMPPVVFSRLTEVLREPRVAKHFDLLKHWHKESTVTSLDPRLRLKNEKKALFGTRSAIAGLAHVFLNVMEELTRDEGAK